MVGTGQSSVRRLKRLARGQSVAIVLGMGGGLLLAAVMWRGESPRRAAASPSVAKSGPASLAGLPDGKTADGHPNPVDMETKAAKARLRETLAELEVLPEAADESSPSTARNRAPGEHRSRPPMHESRSDAANATHAGNGRPTGDATLACWNSINDVIAREAAIRIAPANLTAANASGFVDARLQAGRFAADALRRLSSEQVDPELLAHSQALAEWYDEEARLAGEASALLASSDVAARRGSAGNSWRTAEERHRARCDEINRRSTVLQSQLSHRYNEPFPPMK